MNDHHALSTRKLVARQAGSLHLALWHDGTTPDEHGGYRQRYAYRIADATVPGAQPHDGRDIHSGVGAEVDTTAAMRALVTYLSAAADAYQHQMSNPLSAPENLDLFPAWATEAAYLNSDELTMLALELEHADEPDAGEATSMAPPIASPDQEDAHDEPAWPPARYYTVTSVRNEEGRAVVDLLQEHGVQAAIGHLSQRDLGSETLEAALFNQEYHAEVPHSPGTREATDGPYVLTYQPGLGTVHLLREFPAEAPGGWPDRYTGISDPTPLNRPAALKQTLPASRPTSPQALSARPAGHQPDTGLSL